MKVISYPQRYLRGPEFSIFKNQWILILGVNLKTLYSYHKLFLQQSRVYICHCLGIFRYNKNSALEYFNENSVSNCIDEANFLLCNLLLSFISNIFLSFNILPWIRKKLYFKVLFKKNELNVKVGWPYANLNMQPAKWEIKVLT